MGSLIVLDGWDVTAASLEPGSGGSTSDDGGLVSGMFISSAAGVGPVVR